jgi:ligand-binding sensor domain-containing protein
MFRSILLFAILSQTIFANSQNTLGPIGQWREHYNNKSIFHIVEGDKIYGASRGQVFSIDSKKQVELLGKSTGLNEVGIAAMAWDALNQQLVMAYSNSNIDILKGDQVFNVNDIAISNLYGNKKINDIQILNQWALVSTNFGIVVVDLVKHEVKDTWFPNNSRQPTVTYQTTHTKDSLYAITENGLYSCLLKNNWIVPNGWRFFEAYQNLGLNKISSNTTTIAVYNKDNVYQFPLTDPILKNKIGTIKQVSITKEGIFLLAVNYVNKGALVQLNTDKSTTVLIDSTILDHPMELLVNQNDYWVADSSNGLLLKNTSSQWITLGGPIENIKGKSFINDKVLLAPFSGNANGFSTYSSTGWKNYQKNSNNINLPICIASTVDSKDESWWLTTNNGLLHSTTSNTNFETITPLNLNGVYKDLQFSTLGNLWVVLDGQGLLQKKDNAWKLFTPPNQFIKSGLNKMLVNKQGQIWMIAPQNQGIYLYQSNEVYPTEIWKQLTTAKSGGNLPSTNVISIVEDKEGSIWVGTDNGIGIFNCGDISKEICDAYLPPIKNTNGFIGYLFQKEIVNCMAVDGANRKWIGTNNGAWLLSADGRTIIEHFTKDNSPLPSDTLLQIMIDPNEGEVFFNTNNEMASYRGSATTGATTQNDIDIYPNPVAPGYNGPIAFRGLVENAIVKITELNGRLVYETRALGGQAIWNGKTYEGSKVASGIYLVFVRDDAGNEKGVGKIVITSGQ